MTNWCSRILKIQWFPLSILIFGQQFCFLGPTIFKIPQPNWYYLKATVHASFQLLSLLEIAWYWMSPARRMAANGQKWCETWKKGNNVMNVFIFCSYNSSFDVAKWFQSSNFFNFKLYQKGIKSWSRIFKSQKNVHIILKLRYKIQDYLVKVKVDKI